MANVTRTQRKIDRLGIAGVAPVLCNIFTITDDDLAP